MKVLYLGKNEKKNSGNYLSKIESRFPEVKQKMNSLKMKVLYLGKNEKKNSGNYLSKIESRFPEVKQKMNSLKIKLQNVKMLKGNLTIWSKCK